MIYIVTVSGACVGLLGRDLTYLTGFNKADQLVIIRHVECDRFIVASDCAGIHAVIIAGEVAVVRINIDHNGQLVVRVKDEFIKLIFKAVYREPGAVSILFQPHFYRITGCISNSLCGLTLCLDGQVGIINTTIANTLAIYKYGGQIAFRNFIFDCKQIIADSDAGHTAPVNLQIYFLDGGKHLEGDLNGDVVFRHIKRGVRTGIDDHTGIARLINRNGVYSIAVIRRDVDGAVAAGGASRINRVLAAGNSGPAVITDGICGGKVVSNVDIYLCNSGVPINRIVTDQIGSAEVIASALGVGGDIKACAGGAFNRGCIVLAAVGASVPLVADLHALRTSGGNRQGFGVALCYTVVGISRNIRIDGDAYRLHVELSNGRKLRSTAGGNLADKVFVAARIRLECIACTGGTVDDGSTGTVVVPACVPLVLQGAVKTMASCRDLQSIFIQHGNFDFIRTILRGDSDLGCLYGNRGRSGSCIRCTHSVDNATKGGIANRQVFGDNILCAGGTGDFCLSTTGKSHIPLIDQRRLRIINGCRNRQLVIGCKFIRIQFDALGVFRDGNKSIRMQHHVRCFRTDGGSHFAGNTYVTEIVILTVCKYSERSITGFRSSICITGKIFLRRFSPCIGKGSILHLTLCIIQGRGDGQYRAIFIGLPMRQVVGDVQPESDLIAQYSLTVTAHGQDQVGIIGHENRSDVCGSALGKGTVALHIFKADTDFGIGSEGANGNFLVRSADAGITVQRHVACAHSVALEVFIDVSIAAQFERVGGNCSYVNAAAVFFCGVVINLATADFKDAIQGGAAGASPAVLSNTNATAVICGSIAVDLTAADLSNAVTAAAGKNAAAVTGSHIVFDFAAGHLKGAAIDLHTAVQSPVAGDLTATHGKGRVSAIHENSAALVCSITADRTAGHRSCGAGGLQPNDRAAIIGLVFLDDGTGQIQRALGIDRRSALGGHKSGQRSAVEVDAAGACLKRDAGRISVVRIAVVATSSVAGQIAAVHIQRGVVGYAGDQRRDRAVDASGNDAAGEIGIAGGIGLLPYPVFVDVTVSSNSTGLTVTDIQCAAGSQTNRGIRRRKGKHLAVQAQGDDLVFANCDTASCSYVSGKIIVSFSQGETSIPDRRDLLPIGIMIGVAHAIICRIGYYAHTHEEGCEHDHYKHKTEYSFFHVFPPD